MNYDNEYCGFPGGARVKKCRFDPWVRKIPWSGKWQLTPVFMPERFYWQRSLWAKVWRVAELDMTEHVHTPPH